MVRAHRQAWAWQDEWFNMTMEDIREMEHQTQKLLAQKMGSASSNNASFDEQNDPPGAGGNETPTQSKSNAAAKDSPGGTILPSAATRNPSANNSTASWPISCISESSSEDDEFFDCQGTRVADSLGHCAPSDPVGIQSSQMMAYLSQLHE